MKYQIKTSAKRISKGIKRLVSLGKDQKTIKKRFFQMLELEASEYTFENEGAKGFYLSLVKKELYWLDLESYRVVYPFVEYK
jgi:hypothetical protein